MVDEIKKLLEPHYGHLNFLLKIKREEISINDVNNLINLIKEKELINNLPKELHHYNSYYVLMKDLFFTKQNLKLIQEIKNGLTSESKKIILSLINEKKTCENLLHIMEDNELKSLFFRWSGRIKDKEFAISYIESIIEDRNVFKNINEKSSNLIELKNFETDSQYIPASWCIKRRDTFYNYLRTQRIFITQINGKIYGINKFNNGSITVMDYRNLQILDNEIINAVKSELVRFNIFGNDPNLPLDKESIARKPKKNIFHVLSILFQMRFRKIF
jgi:hypothetical protein